MDRKKFLRVLKWLALIYIVSLGLLYIFQRDLLYFPAHHVQPPGDYGLKDTRQITLHAADGTALCAWLHIGEKNMPTVIYYHGNGGHLGIRAKRLKAFAKKGFSFLIPSYRGYGCSEGKPTEEGLYFDALAAYYYVKEHADLGTRPIILYGESLGTGVAVETAIGADVDAVVLEAPYESVADSAQEKFFWLPAYYLTKDRYETDRKLDQLNVPLLILHGTADTIVPYEHGRALFGKAHGPRRLITFKDVGHLSIRADRVAYHVARFASHPAVARDEAPAKALKKASGKTTKKTSKKAAE